MSCNICQSKFSFFSKEVACPGCGFAYCSKCLKYKCDIADGRVKKVCGPCYNKYTSLKQQNSSSDNNMSEEHEESLAPIDISKKLDSLENPAKPPIVMYKHTNHWDKFKKGLEPADQEIVDRLKKLKEGEKTVALSEDEIKRRLTLLKDEDPEASNCKINMHRVDTRTDQERTNDLVQEYLDRFELSASNDPVNEIEARLRSLQGTSEAPRKPSTEDIDDDDEERIAKRIIRKTLAEAALEKKYEEDADELEEMEIEGRRCSDEDEKPSCVMCDQTESLERCLGCHGDLYCPICFEDNHDEFELKEHKRMPARSH